MAPINKISILKKQIYEYIYNRNEDVYIKIQSLYELFVKEYILNQGTLLIPKENTYNLLDLYIPQFIDEKTSYSKKDVLENFSKVNAKANEIKHYTVNDNIPSYDIKLIDKSLKVFNTMVKNVLVKNENFWSLDLEMIDIGNVHIYERKYSRFYKEDKPKEKTPLSRGLVFCGTSNRDYGFQIKGRFDSECSHEYRSIYAIIHNILLKSRVYRKDNIVKKYEDKIKREVNVFYFYRYVLILLSIIRYGNFVDKLVVMGLDNKDDELNCAIYYINYLFTILGELVSIQTSGIEIINRVDNESISISADNNTNASYHVIDIINDLGENRNLWISNNLKYNIDLYKHNVLLTELLELLFSYKTFKEGQLEAITALLNGDSNNIVVMPTSAGKSLIYYFITYLQPSPSLIIEPTDILMKDQKRNLKDLHNIDDCEVYYHKSDYVIGINHKLNYLTPKVLQERNQVLSLIPYNIKGMFSYVILDEVHTISNWSHNFRPDYLMLSFNLSTFLDNVKQIGFTATANYRVIKDLTFQMKINYKNIILPMELKNNNIDFKFNPVGEEELFVQDFKDVSKEMSTLDNKMIVFTKSDDINKHIKLNSGELLKYDIDVLCESDENSYSGFITGRKSILLSESDMGIGLNIPNVNYIYHYGLPISKAKFVQEIGRAGRQQKRALAYISYIERNKLKNEDLKLLDFNTDIDEIMDIVSISNSDVALTFKKIVGHLDHYAIMAKRIKDIYTIIKENAESARCKLKFPINKYNQLQIEVCLYFLVKIGVLYNWYFVDNPDDGNIVYDVEISEEFEIKNISFSRKKSIEYILLFGNSKEAIFKIESSLTIEEIIYHILEWYYNQFMMYHREQIVNMYEFLEVSHQNSYSNDVVVDALFEYFSLTASNIDEDIISYLDKARVKTQEKIGEIKENRKTEFEKLVNLDEAFDSSNIYINLIHSIVLDNYTSAQNTKMEKYLEAKYDSRVDFCILIYNLLKKSVFNISRLIRIIDNLSGDENDLMLLVEAIGSIYSKISKIDDKVLVLETLKKCVNSMSYIADVIYAKNNKDFAYYYMLSKEVNIRMEEI